MSADVLSKQDMVIQTSYPHLSISLELNIPLQRAISAVPVCRWSALIRRSQIQKGVWHWNLTALLMISIFLFLFSVTSFPTACQKRCVWGLVAPLYMKLCVVQRKDCGFFFACLCTAYTAVSVSVDNYKVIIKLMVKITYL